MGKRQRAACFTLIVYLMHCDCKCSVALPRGALGWYAMCDCGHTHLLFRRLRNSLDMCGAQWLSWYSVKLGF